MTKDQRGAGAWATPSVYQPMMTEEVREQERVRCVVHWIQDELIRLGYMAETLGPRLGYYGGVTFAAVRAYQKDRSLPDIGTVNRETGIALLAPWWVWHSQVEVLRQADPTIKTGIDPALPRAQGALESNYDPGAQGVRDPRDRGVVQINSGAHPEIPNALAYGRPDLCIQWLCLRLARRIALYRSWGVSVSRAQDAAILYHKNERASERYAVGDDVAPDLDRYIELVKQRMAQIKAGVRGA